MFGNISNIVTSGFQYSLFGFLIFIASSAIIFFLFTKSSPRRASSAILRMAWTGISTPFIFVQNAFTIIGQAPESEKDYTGTREFVLFRYSRLQYLLIATFAVFYLSGTTTTALVNLYPASEIAQSQQLNEELARLKADQDATNHSISDASKPDFYALLTTRRNKAQEAYNNQIREDTAFQSTVAFTGPMRIQVANALDVATLANIKPQLDTYFADCPTGFTWSGFTPDQCPQFKTFLSSYIDRRIAEINLLSVLTDANNAVNNRDSALASYRSHLADLGSQITTTQSEANDASLWNGKWVPAHLLSSLLHVVAALIGFLFVIWSVAILVDITNWLIFMMRAIEKKNSA